MSYFDDCKPVLLIIDDLMSEVDDSVVNLFTKGSHHRNVSVVLMMQNLFCKSKHVAAKETQNNTERWASERPTTTRAVAIGRPSAKVMQKIVLVDEFDREYKRLQRPVAAEARANRSLALSKNSA